MSQGNIKKKLTPKEFTKIYSRVPRLCVEIVLKTQDGIVLTKRAIPPHLGLWHIPGGTVIYGEKIIDAVKRVARDELGIEVEALGLIGFIEYPSHLKLQGWGWPVGLAVLCNSQFNNFKLDRQSSEAKAFLNIPEETVREQKDFLEGFLKADCDDSGCKQHHSQKKNV